MQAFRSFVAAQPHDVPFVFAYKGKYMVKVTKSTEGTAHVNAYYYVDNSQNLVDHDFEAGVPAAGQLTIEKTSHVTPGSTADFATELLAFLTSVGLANISLTGGRAFNWYDAVAAYYEAPLVSLTSVTNQNDDEVLAIKVGDDVIVPTFKKNNVDSYMFYDNGRVKLEWEGAPSCPVTSSIFDEDLTTDSLLEQHETADYSIVIDSCDTNDGVECRLVPNDTSAGLPTVRVRLYWREGVSTNFLHGLFYWNSIKSIDAYNIPELEVGQSAGVLCNSVPCIVARTSEGAASLKVSNIGAPNEYPYYQSLYFGDIPLTLVTDAFRLDDDSNFGQTDVVGLIEAAMPGVTVAVTRDSVTLDEMTRTTEV